MNSPNHVMVLGASGHFGSVIFEALFEQLPTIEWHLLGRRNQWQSKEKIHFHQFDYCKDKDLPTFQNQPKILLDLTGPIKSQDGIVQKLCFKTGIIYVDMAVHYSHLKTVKEIYGSFGKGVCISHTGFFPGLTNLMLNECLKQCGPEAEYHLKTIWPIYAGGGKHVANTLIDLLNDAQGHYFLKNGKRIPIKMHGENQKIMMDP